MHRSGREQLDAVASRVLRVEPPDTSQRLIPDHLLAGILQTLGEHVELVVVLDGQPSLRTPDAWRVLQFGRALLSLLPPLRTALRR
jgi:hypothetical protein